MEGQTRIYAYEMDRQTEIKALGTWQSCGPVATVNGTSRGLDDAPKWKSSDGLFARFEIEANHKRITADDFGGKTVMIKQWYGPNDAEWFFLIPAKNKMNPSGEKVFRK